MQEQEQEQYIAILNEIIAKQAVILGPDIAVLKARSVKDLEINDEGKVVSINGDASVKMQELVNAYVELSGMIVKNALGSIFEKYPGIGKVE
jgi:hypothetical protein